MNKNEIGINAGIVWRIMNNDQSWTYSQLQSASGLSEREVSAAIGWLAREDKIEFSKTNGEECFRLIILHIYF